MDDVYSRIERVVLEKYIHELSGGAFKVLVKMIYLARNNDSLKLNIRNTKFLTRAIGINVTFASSIWNELVNHDLLIIREHRESTTYALNSKKIRQDSLEFSKRDTRSALRSFRITMYGNWRQTKMPRVDNVTDEAIKRCIHNIIPRASDFLIANLLETIRLVQKDCLNRDWRFNIITIRRFLIDISSFDRCTQNEACLKYINTPKVAGQRGFGYILRIAEHILKENPHVDEEKISVESEKRKQSDERQFATRLALGDVADSAVYKKMLANNVGELRRLWKVGADILEAENRMGELFEYEWLKGVDEKV